MMSGEQGMSESDDRQNGDTPPASQERWGKWLSLPNLVALAVITLVISCCLTVAVLQLRTQERLQSSTTAFQAGMAQASAFYTALDRGDYGAAHSILGPDLARRHSVQDLRARWEAFDRGESMSRSGYVLAPTGLAEGGRAHVIWTFVTSGGLSYKVDLTVQGLGEEWKIVDAEPSLIPER